MDNNLEDSEANAKISDSAYSNSCSNSQSRRSHSSKSTRSGSHSSGSSGYGGKPKGSYSDNNGQLVDIKPKEKDGKKKKQNQTDIVALEPQPETTNTEEQVPPEETIIEEAENIEDVVPMLDNSQGDKGSDVMEISSPDGSGFKEEVTLCNNLQSLGAPHLVSNRSISSKVNDGFCCVISMQDGVVMYTTSSLTSALGFPKDMWIGRSFIDFVHPRDRNIFASHITKGFGLPKNVNGTEDKAPATTPKSVCTMVCRIRKYRNLASGFGVKDAPVAFMPFLLKLTFKNVCEEKKIIYLVIQATPFFSAFNTPFEHLVKPIPFVIRHSASGNLEYLDPESVPYLGYLPQDLADKDVIQLYHPDDLCYMRQVYEVIVRDGAMARSKCYRLMVQNGDFVKVETEWASFVNPWSRKLEFVIGKHHILEGPANPDVFQPPPLEGDSKLPDEEKKRVLALRESIIRILTAVLTKPVEVAKQKLTNSCQDLASFMENLIADTPKLEEELRLELQDTEHYYERDSFMLGGISPHHDHNDSKSSTETPLSYNQLNYNENLQRYFDSHQPYLREEFNQTSGEDSMGYKKRGHNMFTAYQNTADSGEFSSSDSNGMISDSRTLAHYADYIPPRLTESVINKHNADMEKDLMKTHKDTRTSSKGDRVKVSKETRQKKKEHLARCNAAYQPTAASHKSVIPPHSRRSHGLKRSSKAHQGGEWSHKQPCSTTRQSRRRHNSTAHVTPSSNAAVTATVGSQWPTNPMNGMNSFLLGVNIPQQMPVVNPMAPMASMSDNLQYMSGMIPMFYTPATAFPSNNMSNPINMNQPEYGPSDMHQFQQPAMQCMMYGQALYGQPFVFSPINQQMMFPVQQNVITPSLPVKEMTHPFGLAISNYEQACKERLLPKKTKPATGNLRRDKRLKNQRDSSNTGTGTTSSSNALNRVMKWKCVDNPTFTESDSLNQVPPLQSFTLKSTEAVPNTPKTKGSEETINRTDAGSTYSSFYSSFVKTESGSADDSGDARKNSEENQLKTGLSTSNTYYEPPKTKNIPRRKMEPPWMEQVCVTSELVYKYQIKTKSTAEVLEADKLRMSSFEQPSLVDEQLGQLYLDLQLEGVAARLTLEEGITSSSSSGEETTSKKSRVSPKPRRRREYSRMGMIFEEDAPLPPLSEALSPVAGTSTSQ